MKISPIIAQSETELKEIFEDLHRHPEIGFEEKRTSNLVAGKLHEYGVDEIHTGLGGTGVVGLIHGKSRGNRRIGLRADMDALPILEKSNLSYTSVSKNKMHACGHDGHTTMLLGAAKYLAQTRDFEGTAVLIFQPAEEGLGGAKKMIEEGLFEKYPCDEIYGMHNAPNGKPGTFEICKGPAMAGAIFFDIDLMGNGSHAAMPHKSNDTIVIASLLVNQLQTIVSRNVSPLETCVLSVTKFQAGTAYNVIPDKVSLAGTIRYFKDEIGDLAKNRVNTICSGFETANEIQIKVDIRDAFDVLINNDELSDAYLEAAKEILGKENVSETDIPQTGSEDFADMLRIVPGAYCRVGHSGTVGLHNPAFVLGQEIITTGAAIMAQLIENRLPVVK